VETIRTAIIGYGYAGKVLHAQLVRAAKGLELYAVASRDPARRQQAAADYGVRTFESVTELLRDDSVQLVVLATPHDTHAELAVQCLEAGRHVVTDKIMCLTTAEADAMIAAAKRNPRLLSIFHNRRWDGDFLTLRKAVADGLLGELLVVEAAVVGFGTPNPERWRAQRQHGGGTFRDWGAHLLDQALQLIDAEVVSVYCDMLYTEPRLDVETAARCLFTFGNGVRYVVETGGISALSRPRWYVRGRTGAFLKEGLDPQETALRNGQVDANLPQAPEHRARVVCNTPNGRKEQTLETIPGNWPAYYQNIADHLLRGAELAVTAAQVRRVVALIEAATESAQTGRVIATSI